MQATGGVGEAVLTWQTPEQSTDPVREYVVRATSDQDGVDPVEVSVAGSPVTLKDLAAGTWSFVVAPFAESGEATASRPAKAEVSEAPTPSLWDYITGFATDVRTIGGAITAVAAVWVLVRRKETAT